MEDVAAWAERVDVVDGWRCIGCGRVEASRPCIGVCQDRRVQLVELDALVEAIGRAETEEARTSALEKFVRLVAATAAKPGGERATLEALRARAQALLAGGD